MGEGLFPQIRKKGMREEAIGEMQRAVTLSGRSAETLMGLGQVYAAAGKRNEMQQVLDELMLHAKEHYVSHQWGDSPYFESQDLAQLDKRQRTLRVGARARQLNRQ